MTGQVLRETGSGRINQKKRTRAELLKTARKMIEDGMSFSVADVADASGISRATAYRYFSKPDDILREAALDAVAEQVQLSDEVSNNGTVEQRLDEMVGRIFRMVAENESVFRAFLAASVTDDQIPRTGRRLPWLSEALQPIEEKLSKPAYETLLAGLSLLTGIEAIIVLRDVCAMDIDRGEKVVRWSAQAMLAKALAEAE
ncbi:MULTISPECIES: TetR/AcrR family transcriptional regulator [Rhizobiaceae]|uniref:AcrR family transcriptional regulator n=1 Tax=Aliirhizobium cellulosilyticum TaxID=393664 RepID=A0A7W6XD51_9HYPH|nr:TetR/AcrR family transcriptional regulator [Rhizobium cellulosilyticum]MBB4351233.1 AcrR family transcriptional regulator [Rhizobium cellulosilyticum]MBB4414475.1 AcrR family transcriptional regulator [Rhizobium cellulosilyticum]MBB4449091.1 AcrR family transcriptional regulator [Rhizobium cellulosilyticum]